MKRLIVDLDNTLAGPKRESYLDCEPNLEIIARLYQYRDLGFEIAIFSSRNMLTYGGNVGLINANTLPIIQQWLERHSVPYDEIWVGKPWCGTEGFYVDDRSIRPSEFAKMSPDEIKELLSSEVSGNEPVTPAGADQAGQ